MVKFYYSLLRELQKIKIVLTSILLSSNLDNFNVAKEINAEEIKTIVIFVGAEKIDAYDAIKAHAKGFILEPLTKENFKEFFFANSTQKSAIDFMFPEPLGTAEISLKSSNTLFVCFS